MDTPDGRKGSDVIGAILDKVTQSAQPPAPAQTLFRAQAMESRDVAGEVDARLPLVSRRNWLALLGVGLLVVAFVMWAALTPSVTSVTAAGRVMAAPGAVPVAATIDGVVQSLADPGTAVSAGDVVARLAGSGEPVEVIAAVDGTVWQTPAIPGATVRAGQPVISLLPADSSGQGLIVVPESSAGAIVPGHAVRLVGPAGASQGAVTAISGPLSGSVVSARTGLSYPDDTTYVLVSVALETPLVAGSASNATIVLSEGTVLTRLLGRS